MAVGPAKAQIVPIGSVSTRGPAMAGEVQRVQASTSRGAVFYMRQPDDPASALPHGSFLMPLLKVGLLTQST